MSHGCQNVNWDHLNAKKNCPKDNTVLTMRKCMVIMATNNAFLKNGGVRKIHSYLSCYLSQTTKLGSKLKLRHMHFVPW